jgi:hypothetical protein
MADLSDFFGSGFKPQDHEPSGDFALVPAGKYVCQIAEASVRPTKARNGYYVKVMLKILEGEHANRVLYDNINIDNPSEKCTQIGLSQLSALGRAIGVDSLQSVSQISGQTVAASVRVKNENNEIRTYISVADYRAKQVAAQASPVLPTQQQPVAPQDPGPQPAGPSPTGNAATPPPPWVRK